METEGNTTETAAEITPPAAAPRVFVLLATSSCGDTCVNEGETAAFFQRCRLILDSNRVQQFRWMDGFCVVVVFLDVLCFPKFDAEAACVVLR